MEGEKLDVIVPCKDEKIEHVLYVISELLGLEFINRIIFVDDGSKTPYPFIEGEKLKPLRNPKSIGKTRSVLRALEFVQTELVALQDADLEYPVCNLRNLFLLANKSSIVVSRRFVPIDRQTFSGFLANKIIKALTKEPDTFSGQRIVPKWLLQKVKSNGNFTLETALTLQAKAEQVPIIYVDSFYYPRTYREGKKAKPWHMLPILWEIIKWRIKHERKSVYDELSKQLQQLSRKAGSGTDKKL